MGNSVGPADAVASQDARWSFAVLPDHRGSEPNVLVAPDGTTIYVIAPTSEDHLMVNRLWRSDDAGATWKLVNTIAAGHWSGDGDVAVDKDGSVWTVTLPLGSFTGVVGPNLCSVVSLSRDKGETFQDNPLGCGQPLAYYDRPWINKGDERAYVLATRWHLGAPMVSVASSTDNEAWIGGPSLFGSDPVPLTGKPALDEGRHYVPYVQALRKPLLGPSIATADEPALLWTIEPIAQDHVAGNFPAVAMSGGRGIAAWAAFADESWESPFRIRAATYEGGAWSEPFTLDGNGTNAFVWAAARDGHLAVAWLHADEDAHPSKVRDGATWVLRVWVDGQLYDMVDADVHRGPLCIVIMSVGCEDKTRVGDYLSVDLLPDGRPVVAYAVNAVASPEVMVGDLRIAILKEAPHADAAPRPVAES